MSSYRICTEVTPECPVEASTYGYTPNLGANALFCVIFGLCGVAQLFLGIRYRTWTWMIGLVIGCFFEMAGYIGRLIMHENPWNASGFKLQIVALILSPSFIAAGVDLTMKHVALTFGEHWSRLKPALYTWIFIGVDVFAILVQAAGGGIAASGDSHPELLKTGDNVIIAGIVLQIIQLAVFGLVALEYAYRLYRHRAELGPENTAYLHNTKFRVFMAALIISYFTILIRCIYRLPEMAAGWGKGLQRNEPLFLVLDGTMIAIAAILLTVAHPGIFFPQLRSGYYKEEKHILTSEKATDGSDSS